MTLPALLFGFLVSTFVGAAFHLWKGGGFGRLLLYILLAWIGFWGGHVLGTRLGWSFGSIGPLHFGTALIICAATIYAGYWLSLINREEEKN